MKSFQQDDLELLEYFAHLSATRGDLAAAEDYKRRILEISPLRYSGSSTSSAKTKRFPKYHPLYQSTPQGPEFRGFGKLLEKKEDTERGSEIWLVEFPHVPDAETELIEIFIPDYLADKNDRIERRRERRKARRERERRKLLRLQQENQ